MLNRRSALATLIAGGTGTLAAACGTRGVPERERQLVRHWFKTMNHLDLTEEEVDGVIEYLHRPPLTPDPSLQPALLFNPEVERVR